jgi:hypothetical protein
LDAVLATRGWGVEEFRLATPELHAACHWMVLAERAVPVFLEQRSIAETTPAKDAAPDVWAQRLTAIKYVEHVGPFLFPEDDDG